KIVTDECRHIFVDGACSDNGNSEKAKAGYGIWFGKDDKRNVKYALPPTFRQTNNEAEINASLRCINILLLESKDSKNQPKDSKNIIIWSDSKYSMDCVYKYYKKWEKNHGKKAGGKEPPIHFQVTKEIVQKLNSLPNVSIQYVP